jgi:CHAT domain-containing protein/tetratricopeptide (TPR) repeat protein
MGDFKAALPASRQALEAMEAAYGKKHHNYGVALHNHALLLVAMGQQATALPVLRQALKVHEGALGPKHHLTLTSLNSLALLLGRMGDHKASLPLYLRVVSARKDAFGEKSGQHIESLDGLAALRREMGDHKEAIALSRQVVRLREASVGKKHAHYADSLNRLAMRLQACGALKEALPVYEEALAVREEVLGTKHLDYALSLNNLASLHADMGNHKKAIELFERALKLKKEAGRERSLEYASTLNNLAGVHQVMGRHQAALAMLKEALAIRKATVGEKHTEYAMGLNNLASLLQAMGDREGALPMYRKALAILKNAHGEMHPHYATALNNVALLIEETGDPKDVLPHLRRIVEIRLEVQGEKHPLYMTALNNLAARLHRTGGHKEALSLYKRALELRKEVQGECHPLYAMGLNNLAMLRSTMGDHEAATPLLKQALALRKKILGERHPHYADALHGLAAHHLEMGDHKAALPLSEEAMALSLARLREEAAIQSDRQQLAAADRIRFRLYLRLSIPDGPKSVPAAAHALAWKGSVLLRQQQRRLFLRLAQDAKTRAAAEALQSATRRLAALRMSPSATKEALDALQAEQEEAQAALAKASAAYGEQQDRERASPAEFAKSLPDGAALVDYHFYIRTVVVGKGRQSRFDWHLVAFIHRRGRPAARIDLGPAPRMVDAIDAWRPLLSAGKPEALVGAYLKRLVWTPLERHLADAKVVLVSPDGPLGTVPFAALPGKKKGSYLIEDVALAVVPVPAAIPALMRPVPKEEKPAPSLLVVGGVDYEEAATAVASSRGTPSGVSREWGSLPGSAAEARSIARSFAARYKAGGLTELSGDGATSAAVRKALARVRYAHLATHGYFAPETVKSAAAETSADLLREDRAPTGWHPLLLSGLAFAGANREPRSGEEDGILTALEVSEMDLTGLELAVLSACETGLGKVAGGEGVLGMQRAFQAAGARSVVASLWKVNDRATQQLMSDFYSIAWGPKAVSRAEALRQAQLAMLFGRTLDGKPRSAGKKAEKIDTGKGGRVHPFYWAAFVLSGDWR